MPEYEARYMTTAYMYDGAWMPDPESHNDTYRFKAKNEDDAHRIAHEHIKEIEARYIYPHVKLEELVRVKNVKLK